MRILIACERSQAVCIVFREMGHEAYSCDTEDCYGGHPEWHLKGDAIHYLWSQEWDLVIAFPPCRFLCNSGVKHLYIDGKKIDGVDFERVLNMEKAAKFFNQFVLYGNTGGVICIENSIQHKHARELIVKYNQIIHPWQFGHMEQKATCLWLFGLFPLRETDNVYKEMMKLPIVSIERHKLNLIISTHITTSASYGRGRESSPRRLLIIKLLCASPRRTPCLSGRPGCRPACRLGDCGSVSAYQSIGLIGDVRNGGAGPF